MTQILLQLLQFVTRVPTEIPPLLATHGELFRSYGVPEELLLPLRRQITDQDGA